MYSCCCLLNFRDFCTDVSVCVPSWSLSGSEQFALRYADGPQLYITEQVSSCLIFSHFGLKNNKSKVKTSSIIFQSRGDIKNGTILRLAISPVSWFSIFHFFLRKSVCYGFKTQHSSHVSDNIEFWI